MLTSSIRPPSAAPTGRPSQCRSLPPSVPSLYSCSLVVFRSPLGLVFVKVIRQVMGPSRITVWVHPALSVFPVLGSHEGLSGPHLGWIQQHQRLETAGNTARGVSWSCKWFGRNTCRRGSMVSECGLRTSTWRPPQATPPIEGRRGFSVSAAFVNGMLDQSTLPWLQVAKYWFWWGSGELKFSRAHHREGAEKGREHRTPENLLGLEMA